MDGHIMRCGIIGSCQSAATSDIVKRCWSRVWLMYVSGAITRVQTFTFTFDRVRRSISLLKPESVQCLLGNSAFIFLHCSFSLASELELKQCRPTLRKTSLFVQRKPWLSRNGPFHFLDQSFAQRKHYLYSQAARSKLSWVFTCHQIFIIYYYYISGENIYTQTNKLAKV